MLIASTAGFSPVLERDDVVLISSPLATRLATGHLRHIHSTVSTYRQTEHTYITNMQTDRQKQSVTKVKLSVSVSNQMKTSQMTSGLLGVSPVLSL